MNDHAAPAAAQPTPSPADPNPAAPPPADPNPAAPPPGGTNPAAPPPGGTSPGSAPPQAHPRPGGGRPRGDTRERIQAVALELFAEHGYEATSLREIAERLGVTKAALYYHFRSKEDIVRSFTEDYVAELDHLLAWGAAQPRTPQTRAALLVRYTDMVSGRLEVLRFLEQNQAAVHQLMAEHADGEGKRWFRAQFEALRGLLAPPDAPLRDRVRASAALAAVGLGCMLFQHEAPDPAELRAIVLEIARDLTASPPPNP
jgi:AcrR family transcriptional regulator